MRKSAFTLLELSLVILIISILVVGSMSASITTINKAKYKTTKERLDKIYKAMGNYFITNGSLPCPALITVADTAATYGQSADNAGTCTGTITVSGDVVYGMVPIQDLGLPAAMASDGFGTKFSYVINKDYTDNTNTVFDGSEAGDIVVTELVSGGSQPITSKAIFIIVSHGQNKLGGYNSNNTTSNSASSDSSEIDNSATSTDKNFVSQSINSEDFDDVLFFKTRNQIIIDFDAYEKIECEAITDESYDRCVADVCDWVKSRYNQVVPSTTLCDTGFKTTVISPTKRCGAFGVWDSLYVNPCTQ